MPGVTLRRNPATAATVGAILGLPDSSWSHVHVEFGTDDLALATVTLFLTRDQLTALVEATTPVGEAAS